MTRDKVIALARKAGIKNDCDGIWCTADQLERFAALVAAAERDACAKEFGKTFQAAGIGFGIGAKNENGAH